MVGAGPGTSNEILEEKTLASFTPDTKTYESVVKPFITTYCISCHGSTKTKGDVALHQISANLTSGEDMVLWDMVLKQLVTSEMPPAKAKDQPRLSEINQVTDWINAELNKSGNSTSIYKKLESPQFGNLVNHEKLFSGEIETKPFTPARLWRVSPNVFNNVKNNFGVDSTNLRQPFTVDDRTGIKEYANLLMADSAVVDVLMSNAGTCADELIAGEFKHLVSSNSSPDLNQIEGAAKQFFKKVVFREPTKGELANYLGLFSKSVQEGGNTGALRLMLMAIMLHPESVYRVEIGLGDADEFDRRILSPIELAFSLAYALTDQRPNSALLQTVELGQLKTKVDVEKQVSRMLADESLKKPRILRFFQEFFGYNRAHKVFKDENRSSGFHYYGENFPVMYEWDAHVFVMHILQKDKDVIKELLSSNEYFILHRQTLRNTIFDFYQRNRALVDKSEENDNKLPEEKTQEILKTLGLKDWKELNEKYYLHEFDRGFSGSPSQIREMATTVGTDQKKNSDKETAEAMHPLYSKYPMVYDLSDDEQNFLLTQPYKRPNRAGMLTHPAWLIAHSHNDMSDPIRRGKWIRERLLAGVVLDVPVNVDASIPEDHHKTLRERLVSTEKLECWRCHEKMNPLGFAFEIYDDFGRFRTHEALEKLPKTNNQFVSKVVDASGVLIGTGEKNIDGEFTNALDLIPRLAKSDKVRQSVIRHVFRYYMGRNEMLSDSKTLIAADKAYLESGGSFKALLISLLTSDSFLYRKTL